METPRTSSGKTTRIAAMALAGLFIGLSLAGAVGAWVVHRKATDVAMNAFGVIETGVAVVNAGAGRVDALIARSRTEVRQASEKITAAGAQAQANSPVFEALDKRMETSLAPRLRQMKQALGPVRDAVGAVGTAVSLMNSLPMMAERAPRLAALDEAIDRLDELTVDATQLRGKLQELAAAQKSDLAAETVATLNGLTARIDTRLGEVQANVQGVQADIAALQVRLDTRKSRVLFVVNLLAVLSTLALVWILYTQVVVIRHHRARARRPAAKSAPGDNSPSSAAD